MYCYTNEKSLRELVLNGRTAVVVTNADCKDMNEYINLCIRTLNSVNFNTNILVQPRVFINTSTKKKNILLCVKKGYTLNSSELTALQNWMIQMGNVSTVQDYVRGNLI